MNILILIDYLTLMDVLLRIHFSLSYMCVCLFKKKKSYMTRHLMKSGFFFFFLSIYLHVKYGQTCKIFLLTLKSFIKSCKTFYF